MAPFTRRRPPGWWPLPVAVVIAFVTWPVGSLTPTTGLDPSWRIALSMAVARGVDFGDIAFTYGPLGFLEAPVNAEAHTLVPALAWIALLQVGLAYLVLECSRRTLTWPVGVGLAFAACQLLDAGREVLPVVAFLWAALVVQWGVPERLGRVLLPLSGVVAGLGVLIKFNEGAVALVLAGVAAWWLGPRRWRALGVLALATTATIVVAWVALGNGIDGLGRWLRASVRIAGGYSAGLPFEDPTRSWEYPLFIVLVAAIAWLAWLAGHDLERGRRVAMGLGGAALALSLFKHGFVRHDLGHSASTFTALIAVAAGVRWARPVDRIAGAAVCLATVAAALHVSGATDPPSTGRLLDPRPRAEEAAHHLRLALSPGHRARLRDAARAELRARLNLPPEILAALRGHTVHIDPHETSIIWAYDLAWQPPPVFQDYAIVTASLDRTNADWLRSARAPERILRRPELLIAGHSPEGEGPEQFNAMMCDYVQEVAVPGAQVLRHTPSRCGPERPLRSVSAAPGENVAIPPPPSPDDLVLARVHIPTTIAGFARTALYKPRALPELVLDDGYGYLIPASLASGPLPMSIPDSVGWSDEAPPYRFHRVRISHAASPMRFDFVAMRVSPTPPAG